MNDAEMILVVSVSASDNPTEPRTPDACQSHGLAGIACFYRAPRLPDQQVLPSMEVQVTDFAPARLRRKGVGLEMILELHLVLLCRRSCWYLSVCEPVLPALSH